MSLYCQIKGAVIFIITSTYLIIINVYIGGCATVSMMDKKDAVVVQTKIWQEEVKNEDVKAIVILLHGLNLKPQKMDDWSKVLSAHGAEVLRFALYGHTGDCDHMREVTADIWRQQFMEVVELARSEAKKYHVPIYFIGFSLGALVGLEWLANSRDHEEEFKKMVLIAPALSIPWYSQAAVKMLSVFGRGLMLPSRSPETYRANKGTSIAAYQALFELKESLERREYAHANIPTLVVIDREDELIDSRGVRKLIQEFRLDAWRLEIVDNRF